LLRARYTGGSPPRAADEADALAGFRAIQDGAYPAQVSVADVTAKIGSCSGCYGHNARRSKVLRRSLAEDTVEKIAFRTLEAAHAHLTCYLDFRGKTTLSGDVPPNNEGNMLITGVMKK